MVTHNLLVEDTFVFLVVRFEKNLLVEDTFVFVVVTFEKEYS